MLKLVSAVWAGFGITHSDHPRVVEELFRRQLRAVAAYARGKHPPTDRRRLLAGRGFGSRRQYVATPPAEPLGGGDW